MTFLRRYVCKDCYEIGDPVVVIDKTDYGTIKEITEDGRYLINLAYQDKVSEPYSVAELGYNLNWNWCVKVSRWTDDIGNMDWSLE